MTQGTCAVSRSADRVVGVESSVQDNLILLAEMTEKRITEALMLGDNIWAALVGPQPQEGSLMPKSTEQPSLRVTMERNIQSLNELVAHLTNLRIQVSG